jgi:hypothetical protein
MIRLKCKRKVNFVSSNPSGLQDDNAARRITDPEVGQCHSPHPLINMQMTYLICKLLNDIHTSLIDMQIT